MRTSRAFRLGLAAGCVLWGASAAVLAQARYTCRTASGGYIVSDRPCGNAPSGIYYVPPLAQPAAQTYVPKIGEAPEHQKYLSPQCSAMSDAIRTGPARGVRYETTAELQRNYQRQCGEEEYEARNKMAAERREAKNQQKEAQQAVQASQQRSQMAQQQCDESKRILYVKKRRTDLTEGEKADLQRFEENYKSRCG